MISKSVYEQALLKYAIDNAIVSETDTLQCIMDKSKAALLKLHTRSIYQRESDGRWVTKVGECKPYTRLVRVNRSDLEDAIVQYYLGLLNNRITFDTCLTQWLQSEDHAINPSLSHKSITNYMAEYQRFLQGNSFCDLKITDITEQDIRHILTDIINRPDGITRKRFNSVKSLITGVFTYARMELNLEVIHVREVMKELVFKPRQFLLTTQSQQVYYQQDLSKLLGYLLSQQDLMSLGIALVAQTGLRISEIAALRWEDVHYDHLHICRAEHSWTDLDGCRCVNIGLPKEDKIRDVMLSDSAREIIRVIYDIHPTRKDYLFLSDKGDRATCRMFDYMIRRAGLHCDIPVLSRHKLRKTYTSVLLASGYADKLVQTQLGHADITTTQAHYNYNPYLLSEQAVLFKTANVMLPPVTPSATTK